MIMLAEWKDAKYYFPDGNITLLVSKTLFKVHKHILARDGSTFESMFALDNAGMEPGSPRSSRSGFEQDGMSDEKPIQMQGDTVDEFRDLLWSLYALPHEVMLAMTSEADSVKLSNIVQMAHKYHFGTTESWALQALLTSLGTGHIQTHALIQVTEAAVLCSHSALLDAVRLKWKALIGDRKDLGVTINVTERLGIRDLCGLAYYMMLLQGRDAWDAEPFLSREQRIRLLSGYHSISRVCEPLADTPPVFTHAQDCGWDHCKEHWGAFWRSMLSLDPAHGIGSQALRHDRLDVVGRLMMAVSIMMAVEDGTFPQAGFYAFSEMSDCAKPALDATVALCRKMQDGLMDFFQDVL